MVWSSPAVLASAAVTGAGVLTSVFVAANRNLTGWHFVIAILFGGSALLIAVEAFTRSQKRLRWKSAAVIAVLCAAASVTFVALTVGHGSAATEVATGPERSVPTSGAGGLEFTMRPIGREFFRVAFYRPISLPRTGEGWRRLQQQGGIEVGASDFRMILADGGREPISVLSVRVEILGSQARPHGTLAYHDSQGDEGVGRLAAEIEDLQPGGVARLYPGSPHFLEPGWRKRTSPFFGRTYVLLRPGEVYPAEISVHSRLSRVARFRFVAEGRSAARSFRLHSPIYRIDGDSPSYPDKSYSRTYVDGQLAGVCTATPANSWYDDRFVFENDSKPCPTGPAAPQVIPPVGLVPFSPGRLNLGFNFDVSGATIDGEPLVGSTSGGGATPTVDSLLRHLGAWDTCVDRWPVPGYWTAAWGRWGLQLTFASEGAEPCTATSKSSLRQVELTGEGRSVRTDRGEIEIGDPAPFVPAADQVTTPRLGPPVEPALLEKATETCAPVLSADTHRASRTGSSRHEGETDRVYRVAIALPGRC